MMNQQECGLYDKYTVWRNDDRDEPGGDRQGAKYFVLDYVHDPIARVALQVYAVVASNSGYVNLARDLYRELLNTSEIS
jgi:hypothetical protein